MRIRAAWIGCILMSTSMVACKPPAQHASVQPALLESLAHDPERFGSEILRLQTRLAQNQLQLPRFARSSANYILLEQQINSDDKNIQKRLLAIHTLEIKSQNG